MAYSSLPDVQVQPDSPIYKAAKNAVHSALMTARRVGGVDMCGHLLRTNALPTMALIQGTDRPPFVGCSECTATERLSRFRSELEVWTCDTCGTVVAPCEVAEAGKPYWDSGRVCQSCRDGSAFTLTPVIAVVGGLLVMARVCFECWTHRGGAE